MNILCKLGVHNYRDVLGDWHALFGLRVIDRICERCCKIEEQEEYGFDGTDGY